MIGHVLLGIAHGRRREDRLAFLDPSGERREVLPVVDHRLVDKHRNAGFDERTGALDVLEALVGGDQNGIDLADDVLGPGSDVGDHRNLGDINGIGGIVGPDVGDLGAGDAQRPRGLLDDVVADARIGAVVQGIEVIATVEDDAP